MKKKLLFVITKSNFGGAQRYVFDLAKALSSTYDVTVALGGTGLLREKLHEENIRIIPLSALTRDIHTGTDIKAFFELLSVFKKEKPDIVHLNSSKAGGLGALAARIAGVPRIIYTAHGWAFTEPVSPISKMFRWIASLATLLLAGRVIVVSHFDEQRAPLSLKTTMIHNGIATPEFLLPIDARKELARTIPIPENARILGTIAELHKNKGLDILIRAFAETKEGILIIIGEGEERRMLKKLRADLKLEGRVYLPGFIDNAATLLKAFDLFILPSRKEGLPYVLLEASAAGVPIIASDAGGIPEFLGNNSATLFKTGSAASLAERIATYLKDPELSQKNADTLKARIRESFSLEHMVKETRAVYEIPTIS